MDLPPTLCVPNEDTKAHAFEHYRAIYTPSSPRASLQLPYNDNTGQPWNNTTLEVDVHALANLSSVFRECPASDNGIFDVDRQKFLTSFRDVTCFISMCDNPDIPFLVSRYHPRHHHYV
jgi:hypothetical protein